MSNIVTDKIIPDESSADKLTIGGTGDSVVVLDSLNLNTLQDAGGNNIFVSNGSGTVTSKNGGLAGALNLISTQTPSGASSVAFTSGIDSTYDVYCFSFINMNPATNAASLQVNFSSDGGSNYNMTKTTTFFETTNYQNGSSGYMGYATGSDLAQSTGYQDLATSVGNAAEKCCDGTLYLFAPSNTTYVKQFYSRLVDYSYVAIARECYAGGYVNSTSAINAVDFKFSSGNLDGIVKLYGMSKS